VINGGAIQRAKGYQIESRQPQIQLESQPSEGGKNIVRVRLEGQAEYVEMQHEIPEKAKGMPQEK
jgi:hypothetical protein